MKEIKIKLGFLLFVLLLFNQVTAQKYFSKTGTISFVSEAPLEKIEAVTNSAYTVFDLETGRIQWSVLIKSFEFEKALMHEHFNENYMESTTYNKAKFTGSFEQPESLSTEGEYNLSVNGELEIHGVKKEIDAEISFVVSEDGIYGKSQLNILASDYGIEIPSLVKDNISDNILISIEATYEKLD